MEVNGVLYILLYLTIFVVIVQGIFLYILIRAVSRKDDPEEPVRTGQNAEELTRLRAQSIIHKAIHQANRMLVSAELAGVRVMSEHKLASRELTEHYKKHLDAVEESMGRQFEENAKQAEEKYKTFLSDVQKTINESLTRNQAMMEAKSGIMVSQSQEMISRFIEDVQRKVQAEVDAEMKGAREEIAIYKERRKRVIDERIIDIMEEVLRIALEKKMTLAEQADLVYRALEDAKRDNAFNQ